MVRFCLVLAGILVLSACGKSEADVEKEVRAKLEAERQVQLEHERAAQEEAARVRAAYKEKIEGIFRSGNVRAASIEGLPSDFSAVFLEYLAALKESEAASSCCVYYSQSSYDAAWAKNARQIVTGQKPTGLDEYHAEMAARQQEKDRRVRLARERYDAARLRVQQVAATYGADILR